MKSVIRASNSLAPKTGAKPERRQFSYFSQLFVIDYRPFTSFLKGDGHPHVTENAVLLFNAMAVTVL